MKFMKIASICIAVASATGQEIDLVNDIKMVPSVMGGYRSEGLWSDNVVHFGFREPFYHKNNVYIALQRMRKRIDIEFVEEPADDMIMFINGRGCKSNIGKIGGVQTIDLQHTKSNPYCVNPGTVTHELSHALGLWHEQSIEDRDKYVRVNYQNMDESMHRNFVKVKGANNMGTNYDYNSILHYRSTSGSNNGKPTMEAIDSEGKVNKELTDSMGKNWQLSPSDSVQLLLMYQCDKPRRLENFCTKDCKCSEGQGNCESDEGCIFGLECVTTGVFRHKLVNYEHDRLKTCEIKTVTTSEPTMSPTMRPTMSPTTTMPTMNPTPMPTMSPTITSAQPTETEGSTEDHDSASMRNTVSTAVAISLLLPVLN